MGQLSLHPPVLLCLPPPPQATTGSGPPMALLCVCTVTWPGHVVESLEGGWEWLNWTWQTAVTSVPVVSGNAMTPTYAHVWGTQIHLAALQYNIPQLTSTIQECVGKWWHTRLVPLMHLVIYESNISSAYVDGVSLTHGEPREHIWTFVAARDEDATSPRSVVSKCMYWVMPHFLLVLWGMDYFCDTGIQMFFAGNIHLGFLVADPLWDGEGCGPMSTCCSFNTPPWFYKQLPQPVCRDGLSSNEDIAIEMVEIYVQ